MIRQKALPVIGVLALAACADIPVQPSASEGLRKADAPVMAAQADGPGTYILSFKSERLPSDLAATVAKSGGKLLYAHEATGIAIVAGIEAQGLGSLAAHKELEDIDADGYLEIERPSARIQGHKQANNPADALAYFLQWHLDAVKAPAAWSKERFGSSRVQIGILDSGIDYLHPEFVGLLDVDRSVSFVAEPAWLPQDGNLSIADYNGHGSIVANIAASNAVLTAGVTSGTQLVAIKVCDVTGACPLGSTLAGVLYAAEKRLDVINISIGGLLMRGGKKAGGSRALIRIVEKVFRYAHRRGVTVVVASGNNGVSMDDERGVFRLYCEAAEVICVSATGPTNSTVDEMGEHFQNIDAPAQDCGVTPAGVVCMPYSNHGRAVNVSAPGGSVFQLDNGMFSVAFVFGACSGFIPGCESRDTFINGSIGTSMAAPHVAGLAALLVEDFGRQPGLIRGRIQGSADDFGPRGRDDLYGYGRVNVEQALKHRFSRGRHAN
jgi:subtilisin family serine protease